jgi:hypothetical protein
MGKQWFEMMVEAAAITIVLVAVCQELEKPAEERKWTGSVGPVPYDFRIPTLERIKETYWNQYDSRIFLPMVFGIGWTVNFFALLEKCRLVGRALSEEDFLMPTESIKKTLGHTTGGGIG